MIEISYSACLRRVSSIPFGYRFAMPFQTSSANSASSDSKPCGIGKRGIRLTNSNMPTVSTRSATSSWELRQPSRQTSSVRTAYISAGDLM